MELVYLWVEEYKNIKNQGFNFSPRFTCKYEDGELTIDKKEHVSIFPENINITAIVGENGSGKSSVFENIINRGSNFFNIIIFYKNNKFYSQSSLKFTSNQSIHELDNSYPTEYENDYKGLYTIGYFTYDLLKDKRISHDNPNEQVYLLYPEEDEYIYSYENLLFNVLRSKLNNNSLDINRLNLFINKALLKNSNLKSSIFNPKKLTISIKKLILNNPDRFNVPEVYEDVKEWNHRYYFFKEINNFKKKLHEQNNVSIEVLLYVHLILKYIINNQEKAYYDLKKIDFESSLNVIDEEKTILYLKNTIDNLYLLKNIKINDKLVSAEYLNYLNELFKGAQEINIDYKTSLNHEILNDFSEIDFLDILFKDENGRKLSELSHGEKNFFLVELLLIKKINSSKQDTILFLLDEIETSFHPQWQKMLVTNTIRLLKQFKNKQFHIIFSSHSPFILSDLPKENVIFLDIYKEDTTDKSGIKQKKGNCKTVNPNINTFGANIHTLLSNGFFMKDGLMGEFAKEKINEIIEFYKKVEQQKEDKTKKEELKTEYEKNRKQFWHIQSIVGEEYLKQVIKNHLVEIEKLLLGKDEAKKAEIARLQKQIKLLDNEND